MTETLELDRMRSLERLLMGGGGRVVRKESKIMKLHFEHLVMTRQSSLGGIETLESFT